MVGLYVYMWAKIWGQLSRGLCWIYLCHWVKRVQPTRYFVDGGWEKREKTNIHLAVVSVDNRDDVCGYENIIQILV